MRYSSTIRAFRELSIHRPRAFGYLSADCPRTVRPGPSDNYPRAVHRPFVGNVRELSRLSTGYPQAVHRLFGGWPLTVCGLFMGHTSHGMHI